MALLTALEVTDSRWRTQWPAHKKCIESISKDVFQEHGLPTQTREFEISVLLTDDQQLHDLNLTHRGKDKPTNVLSFPAYSAAELDNLSAPGPPVILGDIAMAFETVARESAARGIDFSSHATHLMIHGYLHVLGFDHETGDAAAAMEAKEIAFCARFGIANPYAIEG